MAAQKYTLESHSFPGWRVCNWLCCTKCGLLRLRNSLTDEAVRLGCNYSDHPNWKRLVHQHTAHNAPGATP